MCFQPSVHKYLSQCVLHHVLPLSNALTFDGTSIPRSYNLMEKQTSHMIDGVAEMKKLRRLHMMMMHSSNQQLASLPAAPAPPTETVVPFSSVPAETVAPTPTVAAPPAETAAPSPAVAAPPAETDLTDAAPPAPSQTVAPNLPPTCHSVCADDEFDMGLAAHLDEFFVINPWATEPSVISSFSQ